MNQKKNSKCSKIVLWLDLAIYIIIRHHSAYKFIHCWTKTFLQCFQKSLCCALYIQFVCMCLKSSVHRVGGRRLFLKASCLHLNWVFHLLQLLSFILATCPAHFHFRLVISFHGVLYTGSSSEFLYLEICPTLIISWLIVWFLSNWLCVRIGFAVNHVLVFLV